LRDEFLYTPEPLNKQTVDRILITFGGVDEGNLTARITNLIAPICIEKNIALDIVTGPGYSHHSELSKIISTHPSASITRASSTSRISDLMYKADLAITSGGRTVLELASLLVPTIVICQNERETTHRFASEENGLINLGYRLDVPDADITLNIRTLVENNLARSHMISKLRSLDLTQGKKRVISQITSLIKE
jgi:spore coat polysaccharide biosynthesis predicted glycosyltransferase SpsG